MSCARARFGTDCTQVRRVAPLCCSFKHFTNFLAGYYCTFLLASFWSEAEKKLFILVAPISKVFFPTFFSVPFASWYCDCSFPNVFPSKILPHAVRRAVAIVWTILLLNYMTVRLRHYGLMLNAHVHRDAGRHYEDADDCAFAIFLPIFTALSQVWFVVLSWPIGFEMMKNGCVALTDKRFHFCTGKWFHLFWRMLNSLFLSAIFACTWPLP